VQVGSTLGDGEGQLSSGHYVMFDKVLTRTGKFDYTVFIEQDQIPMLRCDDTC
jgi:hypothetical protein